MSHAVSYLESEPVELESSCCTGCPAIGTPCNNHAVETAPRGAVGLFLLYLAGYTAVQDTALWRLLTLKFLV